VPRGAGMIEAGVYTPPAKIAQSRVVVVTATEKDQQAYAAVVVTPAQVQVTPIMSVFRAGDPSQRFVAVLPGVTEKPGWKLSASVGTVDEKGDYTPPAKVDKPTAVTLTARLGTETGSAQIVVFPFPCWPAEVQVSPYAPAPLGPGATQRFTATDDEKPVEVAWSLIPQTGTIDKNGLYTAPDTVTTPQAVLVVAPDPRQPDHYSTAVVLLTPDDPRLIMRPEPDDPPTGRTGDIS
jgi:hypothetical protein